MEANASKSKQAAYSPSLFRSHLIVKPKTSKDESGDFFFSRRRAFLLLQALVHFIFLGRLKIVSLKKWRQSILHTIIVFTLLF